MIRNRAFCGAAMVMMLCAFAGAQTAPATTQSSSPTDLAQRFHDALKQNDVDAVMPMIASFDRVDMHDLQRQIQEKAKAISGGSEDFVVGDEQSQGDCAVVIAITRLRRGKPVNIIDPFYMIRRDGKWELLPTVTRWKVSEYQLSDSSKQAFTELEKWFRAGKQELLRKNNPPRN